MNESGQNHRKPIRIEIDEAAVAGVDAQLRAIASIGGGRDLKALVAIMTPLRPWSDSRAVEVALKVWVARHEAFGWRLRGDDAADIAGELRTLGRQASLPDERELERSLLFMLLNVRDGRGANDDGDRLAHLAGSIPARTRRRYNKLHGKDSKGAFDAALERLIREDGIGSLVAAGRLHATAREWLLSNPGKHWTDAPPPRRRRARADVTPASK